MRWTLPIIGIGMIPFIIKPIDDFVEQQIMPRIFEDFEPIHGHENGKTDHKD